MALGLACVPNTGGLGGGEDASIAGTGSGSDDGGTTGAATADSGIATGDGTTVASGPPDPPGDTTEGAGGSGSTDDGPPAGSSSGGPPSCDRALWVLGDLDVAATADAVFHQRLIDLGYDVTLVLNPDAQVEDVGDHCLVVLSAVGSSGDIGSEFRDVPVPVVTLEAFLYDDMGMVAGEPESGVTSPATDVEIVDAGHPMAAGMAGVVSVYPGGSELGWGVVAPAAQVVAIATDDASHATIFGYEAGAMMPGLMAPARRVGFTASGANGAGPTPQGVELFEAAVAWAAP
jgi:hypothetical protein